jgi:hypothetical protein
LPHRRGPDQFALLDAFVRRAAKPKTLSTINGKVYIGQTLSQTSESQSP